MARHMSSLFNVLHIPLNQVVFSGKFYVEISTLKNAPPSLQKMSTPQGYLLENIQYIVLNLRQNMPYAGWGVLSGRWVCGCVAEKGNLFCLSGFTIALISFKRWFRYQVPFSFFT